MPEDLWKWLQAYQDKTGGQVLAIAHNGNLSNGMMFPWDVNPDSKQPLTASTPKPASAGSRCTR